MTKQAFTVTELTKEIGIGRSKIYTEIAAGKLIARKIGKKTVFLNKDVENYLENLPQFSGRQV